MMGDRDKVSSRLLNLMMRLAEAQERMHRYGSETTLFSAEIHMIKCVKENASLHMTALAERLGVTRGAVSQMARRLEEKGMLLKGRDNSNRLRRVLRLTSKGEKAYAFHEALHADFERLVEELLREAPDGTREFLQDFLGRLNTALETTMKG